MSIQPGNLRWIWILSLILLVSFSGSEKEYLRKIKKHRKHLQKEFKNPDTSPLREEAKHFKGHDFFDIDPDYRVVAKLVKTPEALPFEMPTSNPNRNKTFVSFARLNFEIKGEAFSLLVYRNLELAGMKQYEDHLFLPFTDLTTGSESYGGGRYIDLHVPEKDEVEIDFNLAYNPYCAYSDGWTCPIPPRENFLDTRIEAGVKDYDSSH